MHDKFGFLYAVKILLKYNVISSIFPVQLVDQWVGNCETAHIYELVFLHKMCYSSGNYAINFLQILDKGCRVSN